ncbi:TPA: YadA-like family protein, partial [Escherichia coli]
MKMTGKLLLAFVPALSLSVFSADAYAVDTSANSSGISGSPYNGITVDVLKSKQYADINSFWNDLGFPGKGYQDGSIVKVENGKITGPASVDIQNTAGKYLKYSLYDAGKSGLTNTELLAPRSEIASYYDYANKVAYFVNTKTNQILFSADDKGLVTTVGTDGKTYSRHVPEISEYIYEIKIKSVIPGSTINTVLFAEDVTDIHARLSALGSGETQVGGGAITGGENATAVGYNATANYTNSVAVGANSQTTRPDEVNVGNRVIGGLRDGVQAADAATYGQLERYRIAEENARIQGDAQTLKSANTYTDNRVSTLERSTNQQFR